ncbi:MAG: RecQ family ATP-dependent DNA helicase [Bacteroidales bacterium]|jgi:ATP-dependent DNA helicase RecQ|nr:RecQ family ATP-dependent DNA helicase [Bacteroidales bacterium]
MTDLIRKILKTHWGYDTFRPMQEEIILSVLDGKDTLALLPTGGGKSICFQVPVLVMEGICIVVSPLIALMKDQVENLRKRNIKAAALYSGMSGQAMEIVISNALYDSELKFLYISPERLQSQAFRLKLQQMKVALIAVDEAHCISQWGYDFRPPYLAIAQIRPYFPQAPVLALTATATPEVVKDIQIKLQFKGENVFQKSFKRDNLTYFVVKEADKNNRMLRIMARYPGSGIVYVRNRYKTKVCAELLQRNHISADYYHAGLESKERDRRQSDWIRGKTRVIVATNAFGMGIDKPDVRFVIHLDIPDTLESYFQEAGRGGRDEQPSVAIMLYDESDIRNLHENFQTGFPSIETIKTVYGQLCNYYHIPISGGENSSYPFDFDELSKYIQVNPMTLFSILHFLERMGLIFLSDDTEHVSTLYIPLNNSELDIFYSHLSIEDVELFKLLLRSYSGLFTHSVRINESEIARRAELSVELVTERLNHFHRLGAIHYAPARHAPSFIMLHNRIKEQDLYIGPEIYRYRKEAAQKRLESVLLFVQSEKRCRSVMLLRYFGEHNSTPCGSCDVCLKHHQEQVTSQTYNSIKEAVLALQKRDEQDIKSVIFTLSQRFDEEQVIRVIRFMKDRGEW